MTAGKHNYVEDLRAELELLRRDAKRALHRGDKRIYRATLKEVRALERELDKELAR